ncbi:PQQ-binding-like beta-propeller repeat protein, partial [Streptomyces hydrogenans]
TTGVAVLSSPTVIDGTLYIGSNDKKVYALDAATGRGSVS